MQMPEKALKKREKAYLEHRLHWVLFSVLAVAGYLLFVHPDVMETANHGYLLLEGLFKGRFLYFYEDVMAHQNDLYYLNNAHYNIVVYLLFALAELPVFLFQAIFGLVPNEAVLTFVGKLVGAGFFVVCIRLVAVLAAELKTEEGARQWAPLFFALWPPAFFSVFVMGQYDTICLAALLGAFLYWLRGDKLKFTLLIGAGAACKFFPLLLFVPLLLLVEKRPLHILKYGALSLWLLLPTTLLFWGRTGDMGLFNSLMVDRLFEARIAGMREIPVFAALYFVLCFAACLWRPAEEKMPRVGLWMCLGVMGTLFLFVDWHPQWLVLLAPFVVLTTFLERRKEGWFWLDLLFGAGFVVFCALAYPGQLEGNLLDRGLVGLASGWVYAAVPNHNTVSFYYQLLPLVSKIPVVLMAGALAAQVLLKWPRGTESLGAGLQGEGSSPAAKQMPVFLWLGFMVPMGLWLGPVLFAWLKAFGWI